LKDEKGNPLIKESIPVANDERLPWHGGGQGRGDFVRHFIGAQTSGRRFKLPTAETKQADRIPSAPSTGER